MPDQSLHIGDITVTSAMLEESQQPRIIQWLRALASAQIERQYKYMLMQRAHPDEDILDYLVGQSSLEPDSDMLEACSKCHLYHPSIEEMRAAKVNYA